MMGSGFPEEGCLRAMITKPLSILLCWLLLSLILPVAIAEEEQEGGGIGLAAQLLPADRELLAKADELVAATMAATEKAVADADGKAVLGEMKTLLAAARMPVGEEAKLHGAWKVRSLQADGLGAYGYPFFDCRIFAEAKALVFHKAKGSQRRLGFLERDSKERFLFAGAMYFTYDPAPRSYKGVPDQPAAEDLERNCVAWLYRIAGGRLIMVFPSSDGRLEIYEMKR